MNIAEPIRHVARTRGTAAAVIRPDGAVLSYAALDRMIDAVAAALAEAGLAERAVAGLAITGPDELPGLVAALALARLGAASADMALGREHMDWCLPEGGRAAVPGVASVPVEMLWARARALAGSVPPVPAHQDGAATCRIFASSGTTGTPKFAAISHQQVTARVHDMMLWLGSPAAVRVCAVGFGITVGFQTALRTLWTGGTLVLTDPDHLLEAVNRHGVQSVMIAPVSLQRVLAGMRPGAPAPPTLATLEFTGSALPAPLRLAAERRLCRNIVGWFGATEIGGIASAPVAALGNDPRAVGFIHPGIEVEAVDPEGGLCPPGTEGTLRIRSATMVRGYLGDPAASAGVFRDGWFFSGDLGAVSADGALLVTGRAGDIINAGGIKIRPGEIEEVLLALPQVTDAAAFGVPDAAGVTQPWAAIVASGPVPGSVLEAACRERLGLRSPRQVLQVNALPRNANGKLLRDELVRVAIAYEGRQACS